MLRWMLVLSDVAQNGRCSAEDEGLYNFSHGRGGGIQIKSRVMQGLRPHRGSESEVVCGRSSG